MPTARGFVKCDGNRITGTFHVDNDPRHLSFDVEPPNELFECTNATLTYSTVDQLTGFCTWSGTINQTNLRLRLGGGVSIAGSLDTRRPTSVLVRGTGTWKAASPRFLEDTDLVKQHEEIGGEAPIAYDTNQDPAEPPSETQVLESGVPNRTYVPSDFPAFHVMLNILQRYRSTRCRRVRDEPTHGLPHELGPRHDGRRREL